RVAPGRWTASNSSALAPSTVRSTLTLMVLSMSWRTPWISPALGERIVTRAPASRSAFTGSVNSDSSKPSVASTATWKPRSSDMVLLLVESGVRRQLLVRRQAMPPAARVAIVSRVEQGQSRLGVGLPPDGPGVRGQDQLYCRADRRLEQVPTASRTVPQAEDRVDVEERLA